MINANNNTSADTTNLHMTQEVWDVLRDMVNVHQLEFYIENLDFIRDCFLSDPVVTSDIEDFGGSDKVLVLLNVFARMTELFQNINVALKARGGEL